MLSKYLCGHVGKSLKRKGYEVFIRVAEIRNSVVIDMDMDCPNCRS